MVQYRLEEGCSVVEMECAALAVCCRKRGAEFGQFLFTADSLANVHEYDARDFGTKSHEKALLLGAKKVSLEELFAECQVISNHVANLPETVGMFSYDLFKLMKDNAVFINTGRGAQVVEEDLIKALREKPQRTSILDVTDPEPPLENSELYTLSNVILTPHIAGSFGNELVRMAEYMLDEYKALKNGEKNKYEVTLEMLKTMA
jgi:phosphoglycerate dehydrogenase-like enzyme